MQAEREGTREQMDTATVSERSRGGKGGKFFNKWKKMGEINRLKRK